jgi:hypothetical protein
MFRSTPKYQTIMLKSTPTGMAGIIWRGLRAVNALTTAAGRTAYLAETT